MAAASRVECRHRARAAAWASFVAAVMIALNAVLSLVTIIAIYRESGILKRLRSTPLPHVLEPEDIEASRDGGADDRRPWGILGPA